MKKGFSLAEVLIAVTIAAIIGTLGFTIAKKGIARAYDRYIYAGFYAIDLALKDATFFVKDNETEAMQLSECFDRGTVGIDSIENPDANDTCYFTQRLYDILDGRNKHGSNNELDFAVANGIRYSITLRNALTQPNRDGDVAAKYPRNTYNIVMTVPTVKTRNGNTRNICLGFVENHSYTPPSQAAAVRENILVPYYDAACTQGLPANNFVRDINERIDLLPFYIANENTGKVVNGAYVPRRFHNAKQAFCTAIGNIPPFLECAAEDVQRINGNIENGVLRSTDPKRL